MGMLKRISNALALAPLTVIRWARPEQSSRTFYCPRQCVGLEVWLGLSHIQTGCKDDVPADSQVGSLYVRSQRCITHLHVQATEHQFLP
jgi:hypothetical protein